MNAPSRTASRPSPSPTALGEAALQAVTAYLLGGKSTSRSGRLSVAPWRASGGVWLSLEGDRLCAAFRPEWLALRARPYLVGLVLGRGWRVR